jgi:hypothetical protein
MVAGVLVVTVVAAYVLLSTTLDDGGYQGPGEVIAIPTFEPVPPWAPCPQAIIEGELVADPAWGLSLRATAWGDIPAVWPHGFFAVLSNGMVSLVNSDGEIVADAGDHIRAGGGVMTVGGEELVRVCSDIEVVSGTRS